MNKTAIKSMLSSIGIGTRKRIQQAIYNTSKLGWSTDHVKNRKGNNFLAVRCHSGVLKITDRSGQDITQLIVNVVRGSL